MSHVIKHNVHSRMHAHMHSGAYPWIPANVNNTYPAATLP